ncbi:MAG: HD domain-containing protein [Myxococcota bacterium]
MKEPIVQELLHSEVMRRLRHVDQHGISYYADRHGTFTRFEHSVGVFHLLKMFERSLKEQIAGLLHDVSHTVFSHVGDYVFGQDVSESYQDGIHTWYMKQTGLDRIFKRYGYTAEDLYPERAEFAALERSIPDLCADRIEYNLHTAYAYGRLSLADVKDIVKDLRYENDTWYFIDQTSAKKLAQQSLYFTENFWSHPKTVVVNIFAAIAIKRALELGTVSRDEVHFGRDIAVWSKLKSSEDSVVRTYMRLVHDPQGHFAVVQEEVGAWDLYVPTKFRGVDPWVQINGKLQRLTSLDRDYFLAFMQLKKKMKKGLRFQFPQHSLNPHGHLLKSITAQEAFNAVSLGIVSFAENFLGVVRPNEQKQTQ